MYMYGVGMNLLGLHQVTKCTMGAVFEVCLSSYSLVILTTNGRLFDQLVNVSADIRNAIFYQISMIN